MILAEPLFLLLALPVIALAIWRRRRSPGAVDGGSAWLLAGLPRSLRVRLAWLPAAVGLLAGLLLVLALARPQEGRQEVKLTTEGVDIQLVIDISSSMSDPGMDAARQRTNLEIVKQVVAEFAVGRTDDRLGVVSFAAFPRTECPLTLDSSAVSQILAELKTVYANGPEDGTGIGAALGFAARKLMDSDARSRVVVLLTDGEENQLVVDPQDAAALCADQGIKVYAIGAGRMKRRSPISRQLIPVEPDFRLLQAIASQTGGRFFRADDASALAEVYAQIDELETNQREDIRYTEYDDLYQWLLIPALGLLACQLLLGRGVLAELSA